ncbi:hypothetical protein ACTFIW_010660 [Dictyostelium discoideum]
MEEINEEYERIKSSINKEGRFNNPFGVSGVFPGFSKVVNRIKEIRKFPIIPLTEEERRDIHPCLKPNFELIKQEYDFKTTIKSTWIGHSTVIVQLEGFTFLTDPVWSDRCSPFTSIGPKRHTDPACAISELPKIDFVLISHTHYDHLDYQSVVEIYKLQKPTFYVPLGMKQWFLDAGIFDVFELDWWEEIKFIKNKNENKNENKDENEIENKDEIKLIYTPVNHSSRRGLFDKDKALWGGWIVQGEFKRFWFSGDTAYNDKLFKVIGHHYGPFDYSLIAIGAYDRNREIMRANHIDPQEAVMIHREIKSKRSFGIHWGTFTLTNEPILEPPQLLLSESKKQSLKENEFFVSKIGETSIIINSNNDDVN